MPTEWTPTTWRPPRTEKQLRLRFRDGSVSKFTYTAKQINWSDRGRDFDVIEYREEN